MGAPVRQRGGTAERCRGTREVFALGSRCVTFWCVHEGLAAGLHPDSAGVRSARRGVKWPGPAGDHKPGLRYNGSSRGPALKVSKQD